MPWGRKCIVSSAPLLLLNWSSWRPNTCHSAWWAVCSEAASSLRLRDPASVKLATDAEETDTKWFWMDLCLPKTCSCSVTVFCFLPLLLCYPHFVVICQTKHCLGDIWLIRQLLIKVYLINVKPSCDQCSVHSFAAMPAATQLTWELSLAVTAAAVHIAFQKPHLQPRIHLWDLKLCTKRG